MGNHWDQEGWHSRGYMPHFDHQRLVQGVTFRLADSVPAAVLQQWRNELETIEDSQRSRILRQRIATFEDQHYGSCVLRLPECAAKLSEQFLSGHEKNYYLYAWVIMPNHVHTLLGPLEGNERSSLSRIIRQWKGASARRINEITGHQGTLWAGENYDRWIRDEQHFFTACRYIRDNPVRAGLCKHWTDWPYTWLDEGVRVILGGQ